MLFCFVLSAYIAFALVPTVFRCRQQCGVDGFLGFVAIVIGDHGGGRCFGRRRHGVQGVCGSTGLVVGREFVDYVPWVFADLFLICGVCLEFLSCTDLEVFRGLVCEFGKWVDYFCGLSFLG